MEDGAWQRAGAEGGQNHGRQSHEGQQDESTAQALSRAVWLSPKPLLLLLVACLWGLSSAGCRSLSQPEPAQFAAVLIHGNTPGQISEMAAQVFREHGYQVERQDFDKLVFEKKGTAMNSFAYGNWMGEGVWVRVRATIVPVAEASFRLQCTAYMVRDPGQATEEDLQLSTLRRHPYQKLLEEVANRLSGGVANP